MTSLLNFVKIYQLVRKLIMGTDRQTCDLISLTFLFKESEARKKLVLLAAARDDTWSPFITPTIIEEAVVFTNAVGQCP
jgi:hypothetical protein